ncbi:NAD(P)H-hydrate dehydratase [Kaistella yonginensis]|uniref:NAD(P)H-hydrate dehydratase n=1 Tax=Kaistella yonginensis TaxID=658267 RepID=UPI0025B61C5B|nr:NAD(P)H-hydrate dehydratase [Kaistella yonginensis]MDN3606175.1 NAD(P)H-hydrate dehydratase [Kaistella yonginensis]
MKIFSAAQIKNWDSYSINIEPISALQLMERAANSCVDWMVESYEINDSFSVFCGNGNNGGDGFAIARLLYLKGFEVALFTNQKQEYSENAWINLKKCQEITGIDIYDFERLSQFNFKENTIIIDALFGIGLNRKLEGENAEIIDVLNKLPFSKISIDLPSGLLADRITEQNALVFKADQTLTFQTWKKAFLHPETGIFCGKVHLLNIGLSEQFGAEEPSDDLVIDEEMIQNIYKLRSEFSHKGTFGKATLIAGSFGKMGAAVLATKASLKTGSGLTFVLAPKCGYDILQTSCPEAMFSNGGENRIVNFDFEDDSVLGIGPALGTDASTESSFLKFLKTHRNPMILDADALNILSKNPDNLKLIPKNAIITPHPKEFERLFAPTKNSFERLNLARQQAKELKIFIVLKDHHTQIITPDNRVFYNVSGNSGMAKGGSGDALLGILASLLAQNYSAENTAIFGVWLHGKAGDFAAEKYSKEAMLASDLIEEIGTVFKYLN